MIRAGANPVVPALLAAALFSAASGCAVREPPPGGPIDSSPPEIVATRPDSAAVGWDPEARIEITFSESIVRRTLQDWFFLSPSKEVDSIDWDDATAGIRPRGALLLGTTYFAVVGAGTADTRNNLRKEPYAWIFSTGDTLAAGRLHGRIGRPSPGVRMEHLLVWMYPCGGDSAPDLTKDVPLYVTQVARDSTYAILGLVPGSCFRVYVVNDANRNRSLDPNEFAVQVGPDTVRIPGGTEGASLPAMRPVDPRAPGRLEGSMADSVAPGDTLFAVLEPDTGTVRPPAARIASDGTFRIERVVPGGYGLRIFRDVNRNSLWDSGAEPATEPRRVRIEPDELAKVEDLAAP